MRRGVARFATRSRLHEPLPSDRLDSTCIDLCAEVYDWALYKQTKGGIKVHTVLNHEGYLPCFAVITDGKTSDVAVGRTLKFDKGTIVAMDKGYVDFRWWKQMEEDGVYFAPG